MKNKKLACLSLCAAMLLSGCANGSEPAAQTTPETSTASVLEPAETTPAATTAAVAALGGEDDAKPSQIADDNGLVKNIRILPYDQFINKPIEVENRDWLNLDEENWYFEEGEVPDANGYVYFDGEWKTYSATGNRFRPKARYSSGVMSAECGDEFREKVALSAEAFPYGTDSTGVFEMIPTTIHVTGVDNDHVYADEVKYGFKTVCYDDFFVVNAFVRRAKDTTLKYNGDYDYYEVIIDPTFMRGLRLPMLETDPEKMKFTVNGKEFYADTVHGYPIRVSYIDNEELFRDFQSEDFIYAKVALMDLSFTYDNNNGALFSGNIMSIEKITDDTAAIIDGDTLPVPEEQTGIAAAMQAAKDEMITENTLSLGLVDLDFDGTPEVLALDGEPRYMEGPDGTATLRVFRYNGSAMELIGETETGDYGSFWLDECTYIPTNEHGWHLMNFKEHDFLTLKDGKLDILRLNWCDDSAVVDNAGYIYKYLDEEIKLEPYEVYNPLKGVTETFYKWVSDNSLGYSVMYDNPSSVYYMLYENLDDDFRQIRRVSLDPELNLRDGTDWEANRFGHYYTPSAQFPYDLLNVFYTNSEEAEFEKFYGLSYEGAKEKPVIYLYPEEQTEVSVKVDFPYGGELTCTYPEYNDGWNVTAMPDGTLYDANGDEYYCLYWEGQSRDIMTSGEGFCIAGNDTAAFLREKLLYIGLTPREANEFIIYWLPRMQDNPYNIITLHTADYASSVPLTVSPSPDTQIRVFMTFTASDEFVDIPGQTLPHYERNGFTLVEWGGEEVNSEE